MHCKRIPTTIPLVDQSLSKILKILAQCALHQKLRSSHLYFTELSAASTVSKSPTLELKTLHQKSSNPNYQVTLDMKQTVNDQCNVNYNIHHTATIFSVQITTHPCPNSRSCSRQFTYYFKCTRTKLLPSYFGKQIGKPLLGTQENTQAATNIDALQNRERIQREEEEQENVGG